MQVEQPMEQLPRASVGLRRGIGCEKDVRQGNFRTRTTESDKISCDQGEQRGEQLFNKRGFYEKGLLSSILPRDGVDGGIERGFDALVSGSQRGSGAETVRI